MSQLELILILWCSPQNPSHDYSPAGWDTTKTKQERCLESLVGQRVVVDNKEFYFLRGYRR